MTRLRTWLRDLFVGRPDPSVKLLTDAVSVQSDKLTAATGDLMEKIDTMKRDRRIKRTGIAAMVDEALLAIGKEKKP